MQWSPKAHFQLQAARVIEQIMVFALGFLFSGLLTLLFLPALWRRALRLSRRRLEMQMPLSMDEIVAERDQLRAEFAVDRRRIEQAAEALQLARANDMSELGRRAASLAALEDEVANLRAQLAEAQAAAQLDLRQAQRLEISALETNIESLRITIADREDELARMRLQLDAASQRQGSNSAELHASSAEGDELVRKAIVELGAEVLRIAGPTRVPAANGAQMLGAAAAGSKPERAAAAGE